MNVETKPRVHLAHKSLSHLEQTKNPIDQGRTKHLIFYKNLEQDILNNSGSDHLCGTRDESKGAKVPISLSIAKVKEEKANIDFVTRNEEGRKRTRKERKIRRN